MCSSQGKTSTRKFGGKKGPYKITEDVNDKQLKVLIGTREVLMAKKDCSSPFPIFNEVETWRGDVVLPAETTEQDRVAAVVNKAKD